MLGRQSFRTATMFFHILTVRVYNVSITLMNLPFSKSTIRSFKDSKTCVFTSFSSPDIPVLIHITLIKTQGSRQASGIVAFTSYLNHVVHSSIIQTIVFNRVILNDGNGYNNTTGWSFKVLPLIYNTEIVIGEIPIQMIESYIIIKKYLLIYFIISTWLLAQRVRFKHY